MIMTQTMSSFSHKNLGKCKKLKEIIFFGFPHPALCLYKLSLDLPDISIIPREQNLPPTSITINQPATSSSKYFTSFHHNKPGNVLEFKPDLPELPRYNNVDEEVITYRVHGNNKINE